MLHLIRAFSQYVHSTCMNYVHVLYSVITLTSMSDNIYTWGKYTTALSSSSEKVCLFFLFRLPWSYIFHDSRDYRQLIQCFHVDVIVLRSKCHWGLLKVGNQHFQTWSSLTQCDISYLYKTKKPSIGFFIQNKVRVLLVIKWLWLF